MSNTDSFIDEVAEEVRNDKLFALFRKYAWVGVLVIVSIIGGAAYFEYNKATNARIAGEAGDNLSAAINSEGVDALTAHLNGDVDAGFLAGFVLADRQRDAGDVDAARATLEGLRAKAPQSPRYQDLIALKTVFLPGTKLSDHEELITTLAGPGRPYRIAAEELLALVALEEGDNALAIERLTTLFQDASAPQSLRSRTSQLIVALGGEAPSAIRPSLDPNTQE